MRGAEMYNTFFKLQSSPFGTSPDPRFLYMMPHTREALAGLEFVQRTPGLDRVRLQPASRRPRLSRVRPDRLRACPGDANQVGHAFTVEPLADRALPHGR